MATTGHCFSICVVKFGNPSALISSTPVSNSYYARTIVYCCLVTMNLTMVLYNSDIYHNSHAWLWLSFQNNSFCLSFIQFHPYSTKFTTSSYEVIAVICSSCLRRGFWENYVSRVSCLVNVLQSNIYISMNKVYFTFYSTTDFHLRTKIL